MTALENKYTLFYLRRSQRKDNDYVSAIQKVASFETVEGFWGLYDHLVKPHHLSGTNTDYHLFKNGITPAWEDPQNAAGGKWIVRLRKVEGLSSLYWEELLLAIIGEQFDDVGSHICGAVVSVRTNEDIVSLWTKNADDADATMKIRDTIRRVLDLPPFIALEYKKHADALQDKSTFRNNAWRTTTRGGHECGRAPIDSSPRGRPAYHDDSS